MAARFPLMFLILACLLSRSANAAESPWTIFVANDNCPDYTWGWTEAQTRQAFADIVAAHLDEMTRSDALPTENRNCYNAAVTQEVLCFLEKYPHRKEELIRRVQEGRLFVSPYLCNTLWGFQCVEGTLRAFYPARRLERAWGVRFDSAHHIELPSLPWGHTTILAGCGFKTLTVPFYKYDSTFSELSNPPLFAHEGPDGSRVLVWLDAWASNKASYTQGAKLLKSPELIAKEWVPHYAGLGQSYPGRSLLASGTHGDISPKSFSAARGFAEKIAQLNADPQRPAKLVNATFAHFWRALGDDLAQRREPLPTIRGCFGHSWELWTVSLAKYVADLRAGEQAMLAAESLLAIAHSADPRWVAAWTPQRHEAEWNWAMLGDHAWNGTNRDNQCHNADLRKRWSENLNQLAAGLQDRAWSVVADATQRDSFMVFNSLSFPRTGLVSLSWNAGAAAVVDDAGEVPSQIVDDTELGRRLCFVARDVPAFGFRQFRLKRGTVAASNAARLQATDTELDGPSYRLQVDLQSGGVASLVHKPSGRELVVGKARSLGQTVYFDGQEHTLRDIKSEVISRGPVLGRLRITGRVEKLEVATQLTMYAGLDQVDLDVRIHMPVDTGQHRVCQVFPLVREGAVLRVATPGAVVRPRRQPEGDMLPGADLRRMAVQEFVSSATDDLAVTIAPLDAFALRLDLDPLSFEALGNDQNYKEVIKDQHGVTQFRFRSAIQARQGSYDESAATVFGRGAAAPLLVSYGALQPTSKPLPTIAVDPGRAIATCLKPADDPDAGGVILRLREVAGTTGPVQIQLQGYHKVVAVDLLERDLGEVPLRDGKVSVEMRGHGFGGLRLLP